MKAVDISAPFETVKAFFLNPEKVLRLHPAWYITDLKCSDKGIYDITLYDDRTNDSRQMKLEVVFREMTINYIFDSDVIEFSINKLEPAMIRVEVHGGILRNEDVPYWLRGLQNYMAMETGRGRFMKWFLDRFWLRMTPSQRRIALIVLIAEGIGLAAFIAVVIVLRLMK